MRKIEVRRKRLFVCYRCELLLALQNRNIPTLQEYLL